MKTSKTYMERHNWQLRLQDTAPSRANCNPVSNSISNSIACLTPLWRSFVKALIGSKELRVWQTSDTDGYLHWRAYDPLTGETTLCDSEDEMRVWIEQRYHAHPDVSEQLYQKQYYQLVALR